jgi:hypothetical protein
MKNLSNDQIRMASFPDAPITEFNLNESKKLLTFTTDVYVGSVPDGIWFDDAVVTISDFEWLRIVEEDSKEITAFSPNFALREICEFIISDDKIVLRGFTCGPGLWTEFCFQNPKVQISFDESEQTS